MVRIIAGFFVAPIIWPWVFHPITALVFTALTGINIEYHWLTPLNNAHFLWLPFALMMVFGSPGIYYARRRKLNHLSVYSLIGLAIGFFAPTLYFACISMLGAAQSKASLLSQFAILFQSNLHFVAGSTIASAAMLATFWLIAIRSNKW